MREDGEKAAPVVAGAPHPGADWVEASDSWLAEMTHQVESLDHTPVTEHVAAYDHINAALTGALARTASNGALARTASNGALARTASNGALARTASNGALARTASNGALARTASNGGVMPRPAPSPQVVRRVDGGLRAAPGS